MIHLLLRQESTFGERQGGLRREGLRHVASGFAHDFVADGDLPRHDIGERVDEDGRTWEVVVGGLYRLLVGLVIVQRAGA